MKSSRRVIIKEVWAGIWAACFIIYRLHQLAYSSFEVSEFMPEIYYWLEAGMFLSSFPGSLIFVIALSEIRFACFPCMSLQEPLFWMGIFVSGYVQWFYVVPYLFRWRKITTLNLGLAEARIPFDKLSSSSRAAQEVLPQDTRCIEPPTLPTIDRRVDKFSDSKQPVPRVAGYGEPPVEQFDECGRSPVERVFGGVVSG